MEVHSAALQIFVDDFQASIWGAHYFVTINGIRIPELADLINSLVQTGPIGKIINFTIPSNYLNLLKSDSLSILFDDNTTGAGDGYAIDFVKLLVNTKSYSYKAKAYGYIKDSVTNQPVGNALIYTTGNRSTYSDKNGYYLLDSLPAGISLFSVIKAGYDTLTRLVDITANDSVQYDFRVLRENTIFSTTTGMSLSGTLSLIGLVAPAVTS